MNLFNDMSYLYNYYSYPPSWYLYNIMVVYNKKIHIKYCHWNEHQIIFFTSPSYIQLRKKVTVLKALFERPACCLFFCRRIYAKVKIKNWNDNQREFETHYAMYLLISYVQQTILQYSHSLFPLVSTWMLWRKLLCNAITNNYIMTMIQKLIILNTCFRSHDHNEQVFISPCTQHLILPWNKQVGFKW